MSFGPGYFGFDYFGPPRGVIPAELDGDDLEQALAAYLKADASVATIVADRVYPIVPPQTAALPDIVFRIISGKGFHHLRGYSGISTARIRITARSRYLRDCAGLRKAVRQLDGFMGMFGTIRILWCEFQDVHDDWEKPIEGSDLGTYQRRFDLFFKYREAIPSN